jgi:chemotaxis protein MotB
VVPLSRRRIVEDSVNHDRWLVSYADFITLLFAFFVVMYSISQVNEGKYKVLSDTLTEAFTSSGKKAGESMAERTLDPIQIGELAKSNPPNIIAFNENIIREGDGVTEDADHKGAGDPITGLPEELEKISHRIDAAFGDLLDDNLITVRGNEEWLEVELQSSLLFASGDAQLSPAALELLADIADILREQQNPVRVEGFTDDIPINTAIFPSNWELSTARAAAVVQLFIEEGLSPGRFAAIGYGEHQPVADNSSPEGRAANRRVVLMISKTGELRPSLRELASVEQLLDQQPQKEVVAKPAGIEIRIPGVEPVLKADAESGDEADATKDEKTENALQGVKTIELEGGGLLFTRESEQEPQQR